MKTSLGARIGMLVLAAFAGAVYGVVGTVAHASTLVALPIGLVLGIIGAGALLLAIRLLSDRWAAIAAGAGMTIAIVLFSGEGPGGSVIAPAGLAATIWTITVPLIAVAIAMWPQIPEPRAASGAGVGREVPPDVSR
ncbi:histidinol dehydrogenase [Microbacterium sp.]|uniref:histidinol dehydrogenase n=1 Tax=Microbacterium sp. TaxID=51671 RepID=UPI0025DAFDD4|nr:histidinol dehydrogenase [Microbacterium sp.]